MTEPTVVERVRDFLRQDSLPSGEPLLHLFTDAHHTLLEHGGLDPYQRITLDVGGTARHPDLVGQLGDGESLLAVEAKGEGDLLKGTAQAELYQDGFQYSILAAPASRIHEATRSRLERKNIGLLAVSGEVEPLCWPRARQPWQSPYQSVRRQLETGVRANEWSTFTYNLPTHYLAWAIALEPDTLYKTSQLPEHIAPYEPMPKDWNAALRGAETLGLLRASGKGARLTPTGAAVSDILDVSLQVWSDVHPKAIHASLAAIMPRAGAALRILLLQEPMVRLIIQGLKECDREAAMPDLVRACDALDHDRAPVLFFHPKRIEEITDDQGRVQWEAAEGIHYRSTTFYQMKSILKHAGILKDTGLGASSVKHYDPSDDIWALRETV